MANELLREEIKKKGIKYNSIAKALDITPVAFNRKMNGITKFYVNEAVTILHILGLPSSEIAIFFDQKGERK